MSKLLAIATFSGLCVCSLNAALTITIQDTGSSVFVSTDAGSLDVSGLNPPFAGSAVNDQSILGAVNRIRNFNAGAPREIYTGITAPVSAFGNFTSTSASSSTGGLFGIEVSGGLGPVISLPVGYLGGPISFTQTYNGGSLASLGLIAGSYDFTWSTDSVTVDVLAAPIPEPSTYMAIAGGLGLVGLVIVRRRKLKQAAVS